MTLRDRVLATSAARSRIGAHGLAWDLLRYNRADRRVRPPCAGAILATGSGRSQIGRTVKNTITPEAFSALAATLPLGSVAVESERSPDGGVGYGSTMRPSRSSAHLRGQGEYYSDVILRVASATA
jgi:hypothetical protein